MIKLEKVDEKVDYCALIFLIIDLLGGSTESRGVGEAGKRVCRGLWMSGMIKLDKLMSVCRYLWYKIKKILGGSTESRGCMGSWIKLFC
jgi:hypothetical protein